MGSIDTEAYLKAAKTYLKTRAPGDKKEAIYLLEAIQEHSKEARDLLKQNQAASSSYPNWHKKTSTLNNTPDITPNFVPKHKS